MKLLGFFNLLDSEGRLSITNLAVYATLVKMLVSETSPIDMAALLTATMNYAHKRHVVAKSPESGPSEP